MRPRKPFGAANCVRESRRALSWTPLGPTQLAAVGLRRDFDVTPVALDLQEHDVLAIHRLLFLDPLHLEGQGFSSCWVRQPTQAPFRPASLARTLSVGLMLAIVGAAALAACGALVILRVS